MILINGFGITFEKRNKEYLEWETKVSGTN